MKAIGLQGCSLSLDSMSLIGRTYVGDHLILLHTTYKLWASWLQRIRFFKFFHYKSMGAIDPWGIASLDHMGLISRLYIGEQ